MLASGFGGHAALKAFASEIFKYTCATYDWFCAPGSNIIMIPERSCDTEDRSNDAENDAGIKYIFKNIFK